MTRIYSKRLFNESPVSLQDSLQDPFNPFRNNFKESPASLQDPLKGFKEFLLGENGIYTHREDVLKGNCDSFVRGIDGDFISSDEKTEDIKLDRVFLKKNHEETINYSEILKIALRREFERFKWLINNQVESLPNMQEIQKYLIPIIADTREIQRNWKADPYAEKYPITHFTLYEVVKHINNKFIGFLDSPDYVKDTLQYFQQYITQHKLKRKNEKPKIKGFGISLNVRTSLIKELYNFEYEGEQFIEKTTDQKFFIEVFSTLDLYEFQGQGFIQFDCRIGIAASILYALKQSGIFPKLTFLAIEKSKIFKTSKGNFLTATNISNHKFPILIEDLILELKSIFEIK